MNKEKNGQKIYSPSCSDLIRQVFNMLGCEESKEFIQCYIERVHESVFQTRAATRCLKCNCFSLSIPVEDLHVDRKNYQFSPYYLCFYCLEVFQARYMLYKDEININYKNYNNENVQMMLENFLLYIDRNFNTLDSDDNNGK